MIKRGETSNGLVEAASIIQVTVHKTRFFNTVSPELAHTAELDNISARKKSKDNPLGVLRNEYLSFRCFILLIKIIIVTVHAKDAIYNSVQGKGLVSNHYATKKKARQGLPIQNCTQIKICPLVSNIKVSTRAINIIRVWYCYVNPFVNG
jgi:hypothetical protein